MLGSAPTTFHELATPAANLSSARWSPRLEPRRQSSGPTITCGLQNQGLPSLPIQIIPLHGGEQTVHLRGLFELKPTFFFPFPQPGSNRPVALQSGRVGPQSNRIGASRQSVDGRGEPEPAQTIVWKPSCCLACTLTKGKGHTELRIHPFAWRQSIGR